MSGFAKSVKLPFASIHRKTWLVVIAKNPRFVKRPHSAANSH